MTLWWYAKKCLGVKWLVSISEINRGWTGCLVVTVSFLSPHGVRNVYVELFWCNGCTCRCWLSFVFVFQGHVEGKPPARPDLAPFLRAWTGRWDILRSEFTATIHLLSSSGIGVIVRHGCQMSDYVKKKNLFFIQHTREKASFMHIKCIRLLHKKKTDREVNTRYWTWLQN